MPEYIPIKLHIKSSQTDGQGNSNDTEFYTEGSYWKENGIRYLSYEESELSGMEGTTTILELGTAEAALVRKGAINTRMLFRVGCETETMYDTAYGVIDFSILTQKLDIKVCNDMLYSVYLRYRLRMGLEEAYQNEMTITVAY